MNREYKKQNYFLPLTLLSGRELVKTTEQIWKYVNNILFVFLLVSKDGGQ